MKLPPRIRTYAFWIGLSSAVVILAQSIGKLFGFDIEGSLIENVIMAICGVLVVLGIVSKSDEDIKDDNNNNSENDSKDNN